MISSFIPVGGRSLNALSVTSSCVSGSANDLSQHVSAAAPSAGSTADVSWGSGCHDSERKRGHNQSTAATATTADATATTAVSANAVAATVSASNAIAAAVSAAADASTTTTTAASAATATTTAATATAT